MKSKRLIITLFSIVFFSSKALSQGCETLLMNGVFNTLSTYSGSYSSAEWHNFWCNGTVERTNSSSSSNAGLNIGVAKISLGMSYDDAKEFQRVYQSLNCGSTAGVNIDVSTNIVIQKVASPEILKAYVDCKKLQSSGLIVDMSVRPQDNKVFVLDVKYTGAWPTGSGPKVKKVTFLPNVISTREGTLQDGVELASGQTFSLICERSADYPITVYVETEVGTFHSDLAATIPPPTDQDRVMAAMPKGTILGWFDPIKVPQGWALCDGNNGTPNLSERFPLGTTTGILGQLVGQESVTPSGTADLANKTGDLAWDINPTQHEAGQAVAYARDHSKNKIPLNLNPIDLHPSSTKIKFIMKL